MEIISVISLIFRLALLLLVLLGVAFGVVFCVFGMLPYGAVNGFLALRGSERRMQFWVMPYVGWGGSLVGLTLLSAVANFQTGVVYGDPEGAWAGIALIEGTVAAAGIALAWRSYRRQLVHAQLLQKAGEDVINSPSKAYTYWVLWFVGMLIFNWIADMFYVVSIGVDIQGIGPGWIDLMDGWFGFLYFHISAAIGIIVG